MINTSMQSHKYDKEILVWVCDIGKETIYEYDPLNENKETSIYDLFKKEDDIFKFGMVDKQGYCSYFDKDLKFVVPITNVEAFTLKPILTRNKNGIKEKIDLKTINEYPKQSIICYRTEVQQFMSTVSKTIAIVFGYKIEIPEVGFLKVRVVHEEGMKFVISFTKYTDDEIELSIENSNNELMTVCENFEQNKNTEFELTLE